MWKEWLVKAAFIITLAMLFFGIANDCNIVSGIGFIGTGVFGALLRYWQVTNAGDEADVVGLVCWALFESTIGAIHLAIGIKAL